MCITRRAVKNAPKDSKSGGSDDGKNTKGSKNGKKPGKKFKMPNFAKKKTPVKVEEKIPEKPEEPEPQKSEKEEVPPVEEEKKVEVQKPEVHKDPPKRPSIFRPNCANPAALSGATRKKTRAYKYGQIDREELSINNDKTEFLENAQLTKLMSHADMKALMNGQMAPGENGDDANCQDTVEEVDSEMQDIAFSPLLAVIPKEDDKPYGAIVTPGER
ncbi:unnamed protein product [Caenorhabditis nigoni]